MNPRRLLILAAATLSTALVWWASPLAARADSGLPSPAGWPLAGAARVVAGFAAPAQRWQPGHRGVDLAGRPGRAVLSAAAGRVTFAGPLAGRGVVVVDHGSVRTTYEPVVPTVVKGQRVELGTVLGLLASGGHCRGCVHWGLRRGQEYLDPLLMMRGSLPGPVRLMPATQPAVAGKRAAARASAAARAETQVAGLATVAGPPGRYGFVRPVPGVITSPFGMRRHPVLGVWKLHDGTDLGAACGTPIRAPYAGVVTQVVRDRAYGNRLFLDHGSVGGRRVRTTYNHAARFVLPAGTRVARGEVLGYVGTTGYSTGCHLHLMLSLDGRLANPMSWF